MVHEIFKIAIQPDDYGHGDSAAPRWKELLLNAGHEVKYVDVFKADILDQLSGCDGLMWRFAMYPDLLQIARRLMPVIEHDMGLFVYPDHNTCRHYDDKIAQSYLFKIHQIPTPETWVWFDRNHALSWAEKASYPLVMKLYGGASSDNVIIINTCDDAKQNIIRLFDGGIKSFKKTRHSSRKNRLRNLKTQLRNDILDYYNYLRTGLLPFPRSDFQPVDPYWYTHKNYAYFQEYLSGNNYDTRVTIIGDRAFAFRRFNRKGDFRASGSGIIDFNPDDIDPEFVKLAFDVAHKLKMQSCAIDGMMKGAEHVVCEISYTYVSYPIEKCPGYWDRELHWHPGHVSAESAQVDDFITRINNQKNRRRTENLNQE